MTPAFISVPVGFEGDGWFIGFVGVGGWEEGDGVGLESLLCDRCGMILLAGTEIGGSNEKVIGTGPIAIARSTSHLP